MITIGLSREGVAEHKLRFIPEKVDPPAVLDVGCGLTKPYEPHLKRLGLYVPLDVRPVRGAVRADAHRLPFRDKCFGFAWCSEVLEHNERQEEVVEEVLRVARRAVFTYPSEGSPNFRADPAHRPVTVDWRRYGARVEVVHGDVIAVV